MVLQILVLYFPVVTLVLNFHRPFFTVRTDAMIADALYVITTCTLSPVCHSFIFMTTGQFYNDFTVACMNEF